MNKIVNEPGRRDGESHQTTNELVGCVWFIAVKMTFGKSKCMLKSEGRRQLMRVLVDRTAARPGHPPVPAPKVNPLEGMFKAEGRRKRKLKLCGLKSSS